jgi:hypothetical protein
MEIQTRLRWQGNTKGTFAIYDTFETLGRREGTRLVGHFAKEVPLTSGSMTAFFYFQLY